jgi:fumarate reductase subunit C
VSKRFKTLLFKQKKQIVEQLQAIFNSELWIKNDRKRFQMRQKTVYFRILFCFCLIRGVTTMVLNRLAFK